MNKKQIKLAYKKMLWQVADRDETNPEQQGLTNCYICKNCHHVDKYYYTESGTTPMVVECTKCKKRGSFSGMMRDLLPNAEPNQEWFRPSLNETLKMAHHPHMLHHVLNGGLLRRPYNPLKVVTDGTETDL